ncbi:MAG: dTDP-4-dehydrorhamnose 3,5-epimerase [Desulfovibrionales bacterium]
MKVAQTKLPGVYVISPDKKEDERGFFARAWDREELQRFGMNPEIGVQANIGYNKRKATLRGLHYQDSPFEEAKLVRCICGAAFDVALDLRPKSPTFGKWEGVELTGDNRRMLYIPEGCAHGYMTLLDDSEIFYPVSAPYSPAHERGVRWDDPKFAIDWPMSKGLVISQKDQSWPDFREHAS